MLKLLLFLWLTANTGFSATIDLISLPTNTEFGHYNGYVVATVDGQPNQLLICDDFDSTTYVPSGEMTYLLSSLTGSNPLQDARFVDRSKWNASVAMYQEAAFLLDGLNKTCPESVFDLTAYYQYALWHLFTPSVALPGGATAQTLLDDAAASVASGGLSNELLYSRLRIYTPTSAYASNQELLQLAPGLSSHPWDDPPPDMATPEPSSLYLIATGLGLVGLGYFTRCVMRRAR